MKRSSRLGLVLCSIVVWVGCGDTFRPIIIPNPPQFPDPRAAHTVFSLNNNGTSRGSAMVTDVSGDTNVSVADMGIAPVHAVQQSATQVLVVNSPAPQAAADSLTKVNFLGVTIGSATTISLPIGSAPNFVATTEANTAYVSLPNYFLDPVNHPDNASVGIVNTQSNIVTTFFPVGTNPVALAETPDGRRLYVANNGSNSVLGFNTVDRSLRPMTGAAFIAPLWIATRSDNQRVFVLNGNGTLTTIDTSTDTDNVVQSGLNVGVGAIYMVYDTRLNRLYVPSGGQLVILDVSPSVPQILKVVTGFPDFVLQSLPSVPAVAVAAAALPDETKAYVATTSASPLPTNISVTSVQGDGATATYTYTLTSGHVVAPNMIITVSGTAPGFDGDVTVSAVLNGTGGCSGTCFQAPNPTSAQATAVAGTGVGSNYFPQVTSIDTSSNTIRATTSLAASQPFDSVCASTRFRYSMAAAGDSSRVYLASCDGGIVDIVRTSDDTFVLSLPEPASARSPIPPNTQPPPQNPVFLIAGP